MAMRDRGFGGESGVVRMMFGDGDGDSDFHGQHVSVVPSANVVGWGSVEQTPVLLDQMCAMLQPSVPAETVSVITVPLMGVFTELAVGQTAEPPKQKSLTPELH